MRSLFCENKISNAFMSIWVLLYTSFVLIPSFFTVCWILVQWIRCKCSVVCSCINVHFFCAIVKIRIFLNWLIFALSIKCESCFFFKVRYKLLTKIRFWLNSLCCFKAHIFWYLFLPYMSYEHIGYIYIFNQVVIINDNTSMDWQ